MMEQLEDHWGTPGERAKGGGFFPSEDVSPLSTGSSNLSIGHLSDLMAWMNMTPPVLFSRMPPPPGLGSPLMDPMQQQALIAQFLASGGYFPFMGGVPMLDSNLIDQNAKSYRTAASFCEPTCTWSGQLPPRDYENPMYSCKLFIGGVPWDITETAL